MMPLASSVGRWGGAKSSHLRMSSYSMELRLSNPLSYKLYALSHAYITLAPPGIVAAHQVTWKFVYSSFIKADLLDEPFVSRDVINSINSTGCESACKVTYSEPN